MFRVGVKQRTINTTSSAENRHHHHRCTPAQFEWSHTLGVPELQPTAIVTVSIPNNFIATTPFPNTSFTRQQSSTLLRFRLRRQFSLSHFDHLGHQPCLEVLMNYLHKFRRQIVEVVRIYLPGIVKVQQRLIMRGYCSPPGNNFAKIGKYRHGDVIGDKWNGCDPQITSWGYLFTRWGGGESWFWN